MLKELDSLFSISPKARLPRRLFLRLALTTTAATLAAGCRPSEQPPGAEVAKAPAVERKGEGLEENKGLQGAPPVIRRQEYVLEDMAKAVGQPNTDPIKKGSKKVEVKPAAPAAAAVEGTPQPDSLTLRQTADWLFALKPPYGLPPSRRTGSASETPLNQVVCTDVPPLLAYYSYEVPNFVVDPFKQSWLRNTARLRKWFEGGSDTNGNNSLQRQFWDNVGGTIAQVPQAGDILWFDTSAGPEAHVGSVVEVGDSYVLALEARGMRAGSDLETDRQNNLSWMRYDFTQTSKGVKFSDPDVSGLGRVFK
jgi:hypothetical protein